MVRPKKSIDVIEAEGKSHFTKEEIERRKEEEAAVRPNDNKTECPDWLTDKVARKEYRRIAKELNDIKLLTNLDITTLAQYCLAYSYFLKATEEMKDQPMVIEQTTKSGTNLVENPIIRIQLKYSDEMKKHAMQMGLTISSRLKLVVPKSKDEKPKNKFGEFMNE